MAVKNAFYAQSGGVTATINASACGVIQTARQHPESIGKVFAGRNGITGALREELIDTSLETDEDIAALMHTPGGAFGSCRYKLKNFSENRREYERLIEVFQAHDIGYFFYNGGGDSQDTAFKVSQMAEHMGYPITCIGVPKTVDNDLPFTDNCPGFGSVAKYVATSTLEASLDIRSMCDSSTKVFILEVMGRHAGWIAASSGMAGNGPGEPPHIIIFPEVPFERQTFLDRVDHCVKEYGYCVVVASEGAQYEDGRFIADAGGKDAFGHTQLGGVAPTLANMVRQSLGHKNHWAVADYLQRAARHIGSAMDVEQSYEVGKRAVEFALAGEQAIMPTIVREQNHPYKWHIGEAALSDVANQEKKMPIHYISDDGYGITQDCRDYMAPLITGESFPPFENGLPRVAHLSNQLVEKKLKTPFEV
ncbi:pyrophosphate-dependent phosphofructokinase [Tamilnaduibacter salinus]|uniref:Pyrophosphate--fructose 6-phosphate 1-phosphotransferase n=1 Tax=Tamilnaduibacter salinus TaxID=1484056 RepID=A0A2U1D0F5_9GAMM|nr:6-phosphofructokinase [Tamilnaduibacter salinus]PVY78873.1 pyrophosphate-dependent phosphofructokinase [Tamilnaduibacter salinus]